MTVRRKVGAALSAAALATVVVSGMAGPASAAKYKECPTSPDNFQEQQTAQCESSGTGQQGGTFNSAGNLVPGHSK